MKKNHYSLILLSAILLTIGGSALASGGNWGRGWAQDGELALAGKAAMMGIDADTLRERSSGNDRFCDLARKEGIEDFAALMQARKQEMLETRRQSFEDRLQEMVASGRLTSEQKEEILSSIEEGQPMQLKNFGGSRWGRGPMRPPLAE